ncbi:uncharacterized protein LOC134751674 [Cydia strobilella]|uniref:uncharacterized protein LOC134751674 n=1 Tax=Cydia strobilella TaxID=1100964 RepID=UPI00300651D8
MHRLFYYTIVLGALLPSKAAHINVTNINVTNVNETHIETVEEIDHENETAIQIEILQKEKDDLYIKINKAIDEAIPELEKSNDTDSISGLEDLKTLKNQINEIHEASDSNDDRNSSDFKTDFRRKMSLRIDKKGKDDWLKRQKKNEFYDKLVKSRDKKYTSMPRVLNRQKIAEQIQLWLLKQQEEKRKIKEMKVKFKIDFERCPDFGRGREKKTKNPGTNKAVKSNYFPCCRKCCKKSYLGCL